MMISPSRYIPGILGRAKDKAIDPHKYEKELVSKAPARCSYNAQRLLKCPGYSIVFIALVFISLSTNPAAAIMMYPCAINPGPGNYYDCSHTGSFGNIEITSYKP
jgi:hypothetical protein